MKRLLFLHIQKYSCMPERQCVKSCRSLQHCNDVMRFKQFENQSRNHSLGKRKCCQCMLIAENGNSPLCLQATASHYFIHWFDATKFCEQPDNVIFNRNTSLLDSFHCNNVTQLNQTTWFMYTNQ